MTGKPMAENPPTEIFSALSDPIRWSIIAQAAEVDELAAITLESTLPVAKPTISYHIKILQNASLDTAASVAGAVCNINTAQANSLAQRATTESSAQTVCSLPGGVVTFSQAGSVNSGAGPAPAPAAGMPNNPTNPMNPSDQPG